MTRSKIQIDLNNYPLKSGKMYTAISLQGGYATRDYIIDKKQFVANQAFYNVLFNYYSLFSELTGVHFNVQRAVSTASFEINKADLISKIEAVVNTILNHEYDHDKFEAAKITTKEAFSRRYRSEAFRAKYKGFEISEWNKGFSLRQLISDIESLTYEEFVIIAEALLVPANINVYIVGETDELDFSKISFENNDLSANEILLDRNNGETEIRQDCHIVRNARENYTLLVEAIEFCNAEITNFNKLYVAELLAQCIPSCETDIWVDSLDTSIMFPVDELISYKDVIAIKNEGEYEIARQEVLIKYLAMLERNPEYFAIKAATLMCIDVDIIEYMDYLSKSSYETFCDVSDPVGYRITEAQVVLRKEHR